MRKLQAIHYASQTIFVYFCRAPREGSSICIEHHPAVRKSCFMVRFSSARGSLKVESSLSRPILRSRLGSTRHSWGANQLHSRLPSHLRSRLRVVSSCRVIGTFASPRIHVGGIGEASAESFRHFQLVAHFCTVRFAVCPLVQMAFLRSPRKKRLLLSCTSAHFFQCSFHDLTSNSRLIGSTRLILACFSCRVALEGLRIVCRVIVQFCWSADQLIRSGCRGEIEFMRPGAEAMNKRRSRCARRQPLAVSDQQFCF